MSSYKIKKTFISVRIPEIMRQEMLQAMVTAQYGMREKSRWISEAIERFLSLDDYWELIKIGEEMPNNSLLISESFYLTDQLLDRIEAAIVITREHFPLLEGVRSCLIRSSIYQRLLRNS